MEIKEFVLLDYEGNTEVFTKVEELNKLVTTYNINTSYNCINKTK